MWCLSCFNPSTSEDPFEAEIDLALAVSREDADSQEAKQLASAIQESSRLHQREKEAEKLREEQVNKDKELALILQDSLNMVEPPPRIEEQLDREKDKGKLIEDEQVKDDEQLAAIVQESLNMVEPPPRTELEEMSNISSSGDLMDEDEQRIIWESLKKKGKGQIKDEVEENGNIPKMNPPPPPPPSMCGGCNTEIKHERSVVDVLGVLWHPECLICDACDKPIAVHEVDNHVLNTRGKFHNACYERYCYVCKERKMKQYYHHPFWEERYCPAHESDGTPKCYSCERLEPKGRNYVKLGDGRWLCLECMESAVMDTSEALPLLFEIRHFFEGLNMKIEKDFPFLLVEKQALNKAEAKEKIDPQYEVVTRGICLSEEQTVKNVSKRGRMGPHNQLIDMVTEPRKVVRNCEVTAILILYGLPRLMTGYILAHEMMHAYLRLKGYRNLDNVKEEGICQVLGHMWLESQTYATIDATAASSSHTPAGAATASKKGACSDFEKKLVGFCKNQIETDDSRVYGVGFRKVNEMVSNSSLQETLREIVRRRG